MNRPRLLIAFVLALVVSSATAQLTTSAERSAVKCLRLADSGCMIGTGFFVAPDTLLTAAHVSNCGALYFEYAGVAGGRVALREVYRDLRADYAVLKVVGEYRKGRVLCLSAGLFEGDRVFAYGCFENGLREGAGAVSDLSYWMTSTDGVGVGSRCLATAKIYGGFSGGPVVNTRGEVVGLATNNRTFVPGRSGDALFLRADKIKFPQGGK